MSRVCCKLHRFLDIENFTTNLSNERFHDFCSFLQTSSYKKNRSLIPLENPNDKEVYIYLFGGVGTRYLTTVLGEFVAFMSTMKTTKTKWFPVVGIKKTVQTKSLTILGSGKLPIALLLLLSYYENNLKHNYDCNDSFELNTHMSLPTLIPCLLYLLELTNDSLLQTILIKKLTSVTLCDNSDVINSFRSTSFSHSFALNKRVITGHFGEHLTLFCTTKRDLTEEEQQQEIWKNKMLTLLMTTNWTTTPSGYNNSSTTSKTEHLNFQQFHLIHPQGNPAQLMPHHSFPTMVQIPSQPAMTPQLAQMPEEMIQQYQTQDQVLQHIRTCQQPWPEFK